MFDAYNLKLEEIPASVWHEILMLRSEVFVTEQKCVYTDPDELDFTAQHLYLFFEHKAVAYCRYYKKQNWHIGRVVTMREFRNQGLSKQLMQMALLDILSIDLKANIQLSAQVYLSALYRKIGFQIEGKMYLEDGIPHLKMVYQPNQNNISEN